MPSNFFARALVARLAPPLRATYAGCYIAAMNADPVGYLLDDRGDPISSRGVGRLLRMPESTAKDHVDRLLRSHHLNHDLYTLFVHELVVQDLSEGGQRTTPPHDAPLRGGAEHPGQKQLPLVTRVADPPWPTPDFPATPSLYSSFGTDETLSPSSSFEDPDEPPGLSLDGPLGDLPRYDLVPPELIGSMAGDCLAKLAARHRHWERALTSPNDTADLLGLFRRSPAALTEALQQQRDVPSARNPLAWLRGVLTARETELEAAG